LEITVITVKDFMEVVGYRITEGDSYGWQCYGPDAYRLDSWNQDQDGHTVSIVFDTRSQTVYEATAYDYSRERAYRLINPAYRASFLQEAQERGASANEAWDCVNYVDLETAEDFLAKAEAIVSDLDYDTRVEVPLTLDESTLFGLMQMAHEQDITLNQLVENIIRAEINRLEDQRITDELEEINREFFIADYQKKAEKKNKKRSKKN
jgi:hypothetical protein